MQWSEIPRNPSATKLRQFSVLWLAFLGGLAVWHGWGHGRTELAWGLAAAGLLVGAAGFIRPSLVRWLFVGWLMATFPIGWLMSRLVLTVLFHGLFTPLALIFRLIGRDALTLKRRPQQATYWQTKPAATELKRYFQQF